MLKGGVGRAGLGLPSVVRRNIPNQISVDPFLENVVLYLKGDPINESTAIVDSSPALQTITPYGGVTLSTTQSKYGGGSLFFNNSESSYCILSKTPFNFLHQNSIFAVECWVYLLAAQSQHLLSTGLGTINVGFNWGIRADNTLSLIIAKGTSGTYGLSIYTINTIPLNQWCHVSVNKTASAYYLSINGTIEAFALGSYSASNSTYDLYVGRAIHPYTDFQPMNGYVDSLRITEGLSLVRYTSNFNPETDTYLAY